MSPGFQRVDLETNHDAVLLEVGLASKKGLLEKEPKSGHKETQVNLL